ncbi:glucan biosynthesis protein G [Opitutaceae bacterium]
MKFPFLLLVSALVAGTTVRAAEAFGFANVKARAASLAAAPYQERVSRVPASLQSLDYDEFRRISYRRDRAWWARAKLPFQLQFAHPGFLLKRTIQISEVAGGRVTPIPFDRSAFEYQFSRDLGVIPPDLGFAGIRVLYPLNSDDRFDELIVFQGASYFRALGRSLHYGLSARGLALNSGELTPEEFPIFEEFWIERPLSGSGTITLYALLDSVSVAGAYQFTVTPGDATVVEVRASLHFRAGAHPGVVGIAPLTSMFWYGENSGTTYGDFRPEVHDSDGLAIARGNGEWLWRPLVNPRAIRTSAFLDENPRGFGLLQRDRSFSSYQDLEAYYHLRPSAWIEPIGEWGRGSVRLIELPTPNETEDNIGVFWVPEKSPVAGQPLELAYRIHWFQDGKGGVQNSAGRTVATRIGRSQTHDTDWIRFTVEFEGGALTTLDERTEVEAVVSVSDGAVLKHHTAIRNRFTGGQRAAFAILPDGSGRPVELRCYLRSADGALTETWTYLWTP